MWVEFPQDIYDNPLSVELCYLEVVDPVTRISPHDGRVPKHIEDLNLVTQVDVLRGSLLGRVLHKSFLAHVLQCTTTILCRHRDSLGKVGVNRPGHPLGITFEPPFQVVKRRPYDSLAIVVFLGVGRSPDHELCGKKTQ